MLKRTLIAAALAGAAIAQANQIVVDRPPDGRGFQASRHFASIDPSVPLNTFFGYSYIYPVVDEIPGYRVTQFQLYLGSYAYESFMDQIGLISSGDVVGPWHGHYAGVAFDAPFIEQPETDPLSLVTIDPAVITVPNARLESDLPAAENLTGVIVFGRARGFTGGSYAEVDCSESWVLPPRDCQARDGDWSLAYRATYSSIPEPGSLALVFAGVAAVAWTFRRKRKTGWGPTE